MARLLCSATTAEVALSAGVARTVLQLVAPSGQYVPIRSIAFFFDGISGSAEPVQVRLLRQTGAGTSTALTPVSVNRSGVTPRTTARHSATVEPSAGDVLDVFEVHPQAGYKEVYSPFVDEPIIDPDGRVGIELTSPAGVNVRCSVKFEE